MWRTIATLSNTARIALSAIVALTLLPAGAAADLIFEHAGHTYKLIETPASWNQASAIASRMTLGGQNGYLAQVDSEAENQIIFNNVSARLSSEQRASTTPDDGSDAAFIWLGGSDAAAEGDWRWVSNDEAFWLGDFNGYSVGGLFSNWGVQPDDATGNEDALAMGLSDWPEPFYDLGAAGQWNDLDPSNTLMFVVEFDTTVDAMQMRLDEPVNGGSHSGVGMIRGWVVSEEPIDRIEVYVDGEYSFDIPYGDPRADIAAKFPDNENAARSGFSVPYRFSALSKGEHDIEVIAVDRFGNRTKRSANFGVARFEKGYIGSADTPDLEWTFASTGAESIYLRRIWVGDASYDLELKWQPRTQKFEIVEIEKLPQ